MSTEIARIAEFALASFVIELTPGPNMGYLALVAARHGRRAGLRIVAGATAGLAVDMVAAAVGVTEIVLADRRVYEALRWGGVAYLGLLAAEAWFRDDVAPRREPSARLFARGFLSNVLNIKAVVFYVAVMPSFVDLSAGGILTQTLLLGCVHLLISLAVHTAIVLGAATVAASPLLRPTGASVRRAFALGIVATAIWLAWMTRG